MHIVGQFRMRKYNKTYIFLNHNTCFQYKIQIKQLFSNNFDKYTFFISKVGYSLKLKKKFFSIFQNFNMSVFQ